MKYDKARKDHVMYFFNTASLCLFLIILARVNLCVSNFSDLSPINHDMSSHAYVQHLW